jgi:hypothetical protein
MSKGFKVLSQHPSATQSLKEGVGPAGQDNPTLAKATVVGRTLLAEGIICSLVKPKQMTSVQMTNGPKYDHFYVPVTGSAINFHLFDRHKVILDDKRLRVECKVWKKDMSDGNSHLYVDLHPTDKQPTHVRKIWQDQQVVPKQHAEGTLLFKCFGSTKGTLGFIPRAMNTG